MLLPGRGIESLGVWVLGCCRQGTGLEAQGCECWGEGAGVSVQGCFRGVRFKALGWGCWGAAARAWA